MYYRISHRTIFTYSSPITESVMELRMQPITRLSQRCLKFDLNISPKTKVLNFRDYLDNTVHYFNIPGRHRKLGIQAEATVEMKSSARLPEALPMETWDSLKAQVSRTDLYDMLMPSRFAKPTALSDMFAQQLDLEVERDPLSLLRHLNTAIYNAFEYDQNVTVVDSPIDVALENRRGVCQDFAHVMITLVRGLGIPCRYMSGYLFYWREDNSRSAEDATHAWVEAWLPGLGWVGFDPTNNLICGEHHIGVGVGRDYSDVPPTKGVFNGEAMTELEVSVKVEQLDELPIETMTASSVQLIDNDPYEDLQQQQQQQ